MTSPSAAHTGHVGPLNEIVAASEDLGLYDLTDADRTALFAQGAEAMATFLVDRGDASWCPVCEGEGTTTSIVFPVDVQPQGIRQVITTCIRCRGGRLNPFHGCTFTTDDPCACTTRCQVYRPQETPTP